MTQREPDAVLLKSNGDFYRFYDDVSQDTAARISIAENDFEPPSLIGEVVTLAQAHDPTLFDVYAKHEGEKWGDKPKDTPAELPDTPE